MQGFNVRF